MPTARHHRRLLLWASLLVLVLATLAPGISRALAFARGEASPWSVVCSAASGTRLAGGDDSAVPQPDTMESCPFCVTGADAGAPPPAVAATLPAPRLSQAVPRLFLLAPQRLHAWRTAQSRAPPSLG